MRRAFGTMLPEIYSPVVDGRVLLYTLGVTVFGGLLFGLAPVLQTARLNLVNALKDGTAAATSGGRKRLASRMLVVGELTLALIFLDQVMAGFVPVEMVGMGVAIGVMLLVVLVASFLPAHRAASIDPIKALRWE